YNLVEYTKKLEEMGVHKQLDKRKLVFVEKGMTRILKYAVLAMIAIAVVLIVIIITYYMTMGYLQYHATITHIK
ncbi:MAG: hypothetical protein GXO26_06235, partial [Crenarchaeota archaeon]|nr:hypothetical protein [Thermoproteota archaeon]